MGFKTKWNRFRTLRNTEGGFTLVELVIVIAILAILAGVAVPAYNGYVEKAEEAADQVVLGAVNDAFAAACLEYGMDSIDMASAAVRIANQQVGDLAYATHSSVAIDAETRAGMVEAFGRYMEGTDRTVKNDEHQSLVWNNLLKCFEFGNTVALSNGQMNLPSAAVDAIMASVFYNMGLEDVEDLLQENIDYASGLLATLNAFGGVLDVLPDMSEARLVEEITSGSFAGYFTAEQAEQIEYAFLDSSATQAEKDHAHDMIAHSLFLYTADVMQNRDAVTLHNSFENTTESNPRKVFDNLVNTGGMGGMVVNTAIENAMYEAFIQSAAGQQYANVRNIESILTGTEDYNARNTLPIIGTDLGPKFNEQQQAAMQAYDAWLQGEGGETTLAGFMGALTVIDQNVDSIGQESLIEEGLENDDLEFIMSQILPSTNSGSGNATN